MPNIIIRPGWHIPEKLVTPEKIYRNRRQFLREMSFSGIGIMAGVVSGCSKHETLGGEVGTPSTNAVAAAGGKGYPFPRNSEFNPNLRISSEEYATGYNNFYEFTTTKTRVRYLVGKFVTSPWEIDIGGLVE